MRFMLWLGLYLGFFFFNGGCCCGCYWNWRLCLNDNNMRPFSCIHGIILYFKIFSFYFHFILSYIILYVFIFVSRGNGKKYKRYQEINLKKKKKNNGITWIIKRFMTAIKKKKKKKWRSMLRNSWVFFPIPAKPFRPLSVGFLFYWWTIYFCLPFLGKKKKERKIKIKAV